jgi:hypothetical protein
MRMETGTAAPFAFPRFYVGGIVCTGRRKHARAALLSASILFYVGTSAATHVRRRRGYRSTNATKGEIAALK